MSKDKNLDNIRKKIDWKMSDLLFNNSEKQDNYNKNHDPASGKFSSGSSDSKSKNWKPSGTEKEAKSFVKNSKITYPVYHGTVETSAKAIKEKGFKVSTGEDRYGSGIYMATDKEMASIYSMYVPGGTTLKVYLNVEKPFTNKSKFNSMVDENLRKKKLPIDDMSKLKNFKQFKTSINEVTTDIFSQGYDAFVIKPDDRQVVGNFIVLKDPTKIMVVK